jgi:transposase
MRKSTRRAAESKSLVVTSKDVVFVGLDVHKKSVYAAVRINGVERTTFVSPADVAAVVQSLTRFKAGLKRIVYEAGPTGYGLARALRRAGLPTEVIAPGKTPKPANRDSKSDRLDCRTLAEFAEKGLLKPVAVPTEEEEADRQVLRLREQVTRKRRRVMQQIKSLLLMHGIPQPSGLKDWTKTGIAALAELEVAPQLRLALDCLVDELTHLTAQRERVRSALKKLSREKRHRAKERRLRTHPGIGETGAMAYLTEVYQPERFEDAEALTKYLGLAPGVSQSGETRRGGPLMKTGRGTLKALLVEASWKWVALDEHALGVFNRLWHNTGSKQKAITGMARRMAVNLWCMLLRGEDYRPSKAGVSSRAA